MGKNKKHHPTVEDVLARPWCYYCERDFDDQKILIDHQKAKHFKCDHCNRRLSTAGGLQVHLQQVHKVTLTVIDNAMEGRQNVEPEIFGMMGIPEELVEAHRQRVTNAFFKEQADRRAQTGNPPPGQGQPNAKKRKVEETSEERKARLAEHIAKRRAERLAGREPKGVQESSSDTPAPTQPSANTSTTDFMAPPPLASYDNSYYERPQQLPQFAPYLGLPLQSPHGTGYSPPFPVQQTGQWPSNMRPQSFSPPQAAPYATPPFMPPVRPPVTAPMPSMATPNHNNHYSPTITRQPMILQHAPGLPARPSFDPPSFNRDDMQRMHSGQAPPQANNAGQSRPANKPRELPAEEKIDKMLKDSKTEFWQKLVWEAAANPSPDMDMDVLKQSFDEMALEAKNECLKKLASDATANAHQDAMITKIIDKIFGPFEEEYRKRVAARAAANGTQGVTNPVPEHGPVSQNVHNGLVLRTKGPSELIYDHHNESPEQKMAKRSKYAFQRNGA